MANTQAGKRVSTVNKSAAEENCASVEKVLRHQTTVRIARYKELKQLADEKKWSFNTALNDAVEFYLSDKKDKFKK